MGGGVMKKVLVVIGAIIVVLIVIVVAVPFFIDANQFRPRIETQLTDAIGRQVKIGNLSLKLWRGQLGADNISIADDPAFSRNPFVQAKALDISVEIMPLILSRAVHVQSLTLEQPQVALIRSANGTWNFSSIGQQKGSQPASQPAAKKTQTAPAPAGGGNGNAAMPQIQIQKLEIVNGRILLGSPGRRPQTYDGVNL